MKNNIKFLLMILLAIAFIKMPFGYYQFVRFATFIGCGYLAYRDYEDKIKITAPIYALIALIFNPIIKFYFGREGWEIIDLIAIMLLGISLIIERKIVTQKQ